ncbi:type I polyketide synthase [Aquimarina aquimarini]|uniref:type I polyketide synthase n=1 Tax=Aquimarina aquimarini TaxID=1191734 RepID=UPI001F2071A8|nr:beta-ketoacyl synthase N-terminal-like domain-containing protein [Aquimarina aquimarini]
MSTGNYRELLEKAVHSIKDGKNRIRELENEKYEPIAIVGTSCRLPGKIVDLDSLHTILKNKTDTISDIPSNRWDIDRYYSSQPEQGKIYAKQAGIIDNVDKFDAEFFKISPEEAKMMDPQYRVLLEMSWEALENSNILPKTLHNYLTGVFVGISSVDYLSQICRKVDEKAYNSYTSIGNSNSTAAGRISSYLGLKGPCMIFDTACSSSLTALHQACESLRRKECDLALTGGVNLLLSPVSMLAFSQTGVLSSDNRCYTFDNTANGYVRSEGGGMIVLKRLSTAIKEGDTILAQIIGSSINHNGSGGGLTVPNGASQKELIQQALKNAKITPDQIDYIEAHGTGTLFGDLIEMKALHEVFSESKTKEHPMFVGAIKTNIGHLEAASGIAGILKIISQLKNEQLYPHLHFNTPNSHIKWKDMAIEIPVKKIPWKPSDSKRRIGGVSSFGISGSNAHVIIEEFMNTSEKTITTNILKKYPIIIVVSAKTKESLTTYIQLLVNYLNSNNTNESILIRMAYTLQTARTPMKERVAFIVSNVEQLKTKFNQYLKKEDITEGFFLGKVTKVNNFPTRPTLKEKNIHELAQLWVKGTNIDWSLLYENDNYPSKISLPTYPFNRTRYWVPKSKKTISNSSNNLHPLLHSNESSLKGQKYKSTYTGKETFLFTHRNNEKKIFPEVAHIELARAAGQYSTESTVTQLQDITWFDPIQINGKPEYIHTSLDLIDKKLRFEIYSENGEEKKIHSQGKIGTKKLKPLPNHNLKSLQKRCLKYISKEHCYTQFEAKGLNYDVRFQGIEELWHNDKEALSKIKLPQKGDYVLQPEILENALQTCLILNLNKETPLDITLPFAIQELNIYEDIPEILWCYVRENINNKPSIDEVNYDIDLLNNTGEALVSFRNLRKKEACYKEYSESNIDDLIKELTSGYSFTSLDNFIEEISNKKLETLISIFKNT